ncbi:FGGY-family carbohydrate kinase [Bacillus licheniformis]|nr:FGGY-family carbohydrate kinase [Bacillus licheniformis]
MIRAALEGVIYNLYTVFLALTECMDGPVARIQATGGFARSDVWRQMMADISNRKSSCRKAMKALVSEPAFGTVRDGKIDSFDVVSDMVGSTHRHAPKEESAKEYRN